MPQESITRAEDILERHLASYGREGSSGGGIKLIGGRKWWTVRGRELEGEWIEVRFELSYPAGSTAADLDRCKKTTCEGHIRDLLLYLIPHHLSRPRARHRCDIPSCREGKLHSAVSKIVLAGRSLETV